MQPRQLSAMLGIKKKVKSHTVKPPDRTIWSNWAKDKILFLQQHNIVITLIHQFGDYINIQKLSPHTIQIGKDQIPDLTV